MSRAGNVLAYAVLGCWACVCLLPFYWVAATSLKGAFEINGGPFYLPFVDYRPSLDAWAYLLTESVDSPMLRYFNSVVVGVTSTLLTVFLAALAVYGLTRFRHAVPWSRPALALLGVAAAGWAFITPASTLRFPLGIAAILLLLMAAWVSRRGPVLRNSGILTAILATRILPPVVVVLPVYLMAQYTGTLDTRFTLILTYTASNLPVAVWLLQPVLGASATDQEESAQLDGASHFRVFLTIVLPMAAPGVAAAGLLIFILCWNEYLFSVYLAADNAMTMPPFLAGQMSVREQQAASDAEEWARLCASIILMAVPLAICTAFAQGLLRRMTLWNR